MIQYLKLLSQVKMGWVLFVFIIVLFASAHFVKPRPHINDSTIPIESVIELEAKERILKVRANNMLKMVKRQKSLSPNEYNVLLTKTDNVLSELLKVQEQIIELKTRRYKELKKSLNNG